jgi:hypothetical protein
MLLAAMKDIYATSVTPADVDYQHWVYLSLRGILPLNGKDHRFAQRPLWGMTSVITNKVFHLSGPNLFRRYSARL